MKILRYHGQVTTPEPTANRSGSFPDPSIEADCSSPSLLELAASWNQTTRASNPIQANDTIFINSGSSSRHRQLVHPPNSSSPIRIAPRRNQLIGQSRNHLK
ncbi:hypothetical protein V6000_005961 [Aspergillus fumigatus]